MLSEEDNTPFTTSLDAARDLRLDPDKEYLIYEFWSQTYKGTFRGTFAPQPVKPYDCDVYCLVEKQSRPTLLSTSRHVRQMAVDIKELTFDGYRRELNGVSRAVANDPYQLRIYVPDGYVAKTVTLSGGLDATMVSANNLLLVNFVSNTGDDVKWAVQF
jgi:hypothetical protein